MKTESCHKIKLTDKLEIDMIELPKIIGKDSNQDKLLDWLYFLEEPKLSEDEKMQRIADLREKVILDEKAIYAKGLEKGARYE